MNGSRPLSHIKSALKYKVHLTLGLWMKPQCVTIQMKAIEQYFDAVLFTEWFLLITLDCDHSSYRKLVTNNIWLYIPHK